MSGSSLVGFIGEGCNEMCEYSRMNTSGQRPSCSFCSQLPVGVDRCLSKLILLTAPRFGLFQCAL